MYCESCGAKNERDAKFCTSCGELLENDSSCEEELMFSKEKYKKLISTFETFVALTYIFSFLIGIGVSIQMISEDSDLIILAFFPPLIALFIAWASTIYLRVRIEEMKWRLDFYEKHI